ncbi:pentapeptide repeat-containing protein [Modestobacter italicus]|uniref:pentapeptide repeat-containing protein n=1 Tax=Modestobacter italicus (strain DSM 44449 / CECT 9708 / BC 501) TaxID=2732864 RepID=UPI001C98A157|nr:pentapeptide repeat-containing protein [Modestobacter italicus]
MAPRSQNVLPAPPQLPADLTEEHLLAADLTAHVEQRALHGEVEDVLLDDVEVSASRLARLRLIGGRITRCQFTDVEVVDSDLSGVDVPDSRWQRVAVRDSRLAGVSVAGSTWSDVTLTDVRAARLDLRFATVRRARFTRCDLSALDLTGATLDGVVFEDCRLVEARFAQLTVKRAEFVDCDTSAAVGVDSLRSAVVDATTLMSLAAPMAATLGLRLS